MQSTRLETERLVLRNWEEGDVAAMHGILQDEEVMRYLKHHPLDQIECIQGIAEKAINNIQTKSYGYFICVDKELGRVLGMMGLNYTEIAAEHFPAYTISWILGKEYWKKGYAQEAAKALVDHAEALKIQKLFACTVVENEASIKVMKNLGMVFVHEFDFPNVENQKLRKHVLYRYSLQ